jgi:hypothetical protein
MNNSTTGGDLYLPSATNDSPVQENEVDNDVWLNVGTGFPNRCPW